MAQHVIFLVHGAGTYTKDGKPDKNADWFKSAKKTIKSTFKESVALKGEKFDDWFTFEPVVYDDFFHRLVSDWATGAKLYSPIFGAGTFGRTLFEFFDGAADIEDNFLWTNAADLFLYSAFGTGSRLVRPAVISKVREQITGGLKKHKGKRWSVIAHSLGTAVTHDALAQLAKSEEFSLAGKAEVVAMIANLSKTLESATFGGEVYKSKVRPGGITESYLSAVHQFDPVSLFQQFDPPNDVGWASRHGFNKVHGLDHFYLDGDDDDIGELSLANPITHDFDHYFQHPKVHLSFFQKAESWLGIKNSDINAAALKFKDQQNKALEKFVKSKFDDIAPGGGDDLIAFLDKLDVIMKRWI